MKTVITRVDCPNMAKYRIRNNGLVSKLRPFRSKVELFQISHIMDFDSILYRNGGNLLMSPLFFSSFIDIDVLDLRYHAFICSKSSYSLPFSAPPVCGD